MFTPETRKTKEPQKRNPEPTQLQQGGGGISDPPSSPLREDVGEGWMGWGRGRRETKGDSRSASATLAKYAKCAEKLAPN